MHNEQTRDRFIELRAQNWTFEHIARELNVAKSTLVIWSRQFQHDIQNLRAMRTEALQEKYLASDEARLQALRQNLDQVDAELAKRDLTSLPTWRLLTLAATLRREVSQHVRPVTLTVPEHEIPVHERHPATQAWQA